METGAAKISLTGAIVAGNLRAVRRYLADGGDPDRRLSEGSRPLHWASYWGQFAIAEALVRLLLEAGAVPLRNASGETPAAYAKSADDAALLIAYRRRPAPAAA